MSELQISKTSKKILIDIYKNKKTLKLKILMILNFHIQMIYVQSIMKIMFIKL